MQDFKNLKVWQKSHVLLLEVYRAVESFPKEELFGLSRQLKEAALSIEANLAEGTGKSGDVDFKRFVSISLGSACELESHMIAARDLKFLASPAFERLNSMCQEVRRMLVALVRRLSASTKRPPRRPPQAGSSGLEARS
jgi:four helix bundle protein